MIGLDGLVDGALGTCDDDGAAHSQKHKSFVEYVYFGGNVEMYKSGLMRSPIKIIFKAHRFIFFPVFKVFLCHSVTTL